MLPHTPRFLLTMCILAASLLAPATAWSKPLDGVGKLKFGMTPEAVEALTGCSSSSECLYELLGKNRYFKLSYDAPFPSDPTTHPPQASTENRLRIIDVDMGNYTSEWFMELFEVLHSQYALVHSPSDQEDSFFNQGQHSELIIGFADGHVLLKVVRRTFGNLILRVIFQDAASATHIRQSWALSPSSSVPPGP